MNRRNLFNVLVGKKVNENDAERPSEILTGLLPYTGVWEFDQAAHLLRRSMFGASRKQIEVAVLEGLDATIDKLFDDSIKPTEGPINPGKWYDKEGVFHELNDPNIPRETPWVFKLNGVWKVGHIAGDSDIEDLNNKSRNVTLRNWKTRQILTEGVSIIQKMTMFWHNHYVIHEDLDFRRIGFLYIMTLQENALGNFRELSKIISTDPAMLIYLNNETNTAAAPNENYARELFELFTIGKGDLAGPGDYTNYTEEDIRSAARVLTGWRIKNHEINQGEGTFDLTQENLSEFHAPNHDTGTKKFSNRFGNKSISDQGKEEFKALVDMIYDQDECARFICRKLYRWFVYYKITAEIEENVIEPMAQLLIENDYEIKPALKVLLKSEHFYDQRKSGLMIKNPYDFMMSFLKPFDFNAIAPTHDIFENEKFYYDLTKVFNLQQMTYFGHPNVAGWKAYYQEPQFYRAWLNSTTLTVRMNATYKLAMSVDNNGAYSYLGLDVLKIIADIPNVSNPNEMIDSLSQILYPRPLAAEQKDYLKDVLLGGLPDFEWTVEYGAYLSNPDNNAIKTSVESKLRQLINAMLSMPEFYLC